jgi:hypothetical protein
VICCSAYMFLPVSVINFFLKFVDNLNECLLVLALDISYVNDFNGQHHF